MIPQIFKLIPLQDYGNVETTHVGQDVGGRVKSHGLIVFPQRRDYDKIPLNND